MQMRLDLKGGWLREQAFGEQAGENIFIGTLSGPKWMLALANACVVANLLGQWQVRGWALADLGHAGKLHHQVALVVQGKRLLHPIPWCSQVTNAPYLNQSSRAGPVCLCS